MDTIYILNAIQVIDVRLDYLSEVLYETNNRQPIREMILRLKAARADLEAQL